jgi:hypothetical protein
MHPLQPAHFHGVPLITTLVLCGVVGALLGLALL